MIFFTLLLLILSISMPPSTQQTVLTADEPSVKATHVAKTSDKVTAPANQTSAATSNTTITTSTGKTPAPSTKVAGPLYSVDKSSVSLLRGGTNTVTLTPLSGYKVGFTFITSGSGWGVSGKPGDPTRTMSNTPYTLNLFADNTAPYGTYALTIGGHDNYGHYEQRVINVTITGPAEFKINADSITENSSDDSSFIINMSIIRSNGHTSKVSLYPSPHSGSYISCTNTGAISGSTAQIYCRINDSTPPGDYSIDITAYDEQMKYATDYISVLVD